MLDVFRDLKKKHRPELVRIAPKEVRLLSIVSDTIIGLRSRQKPNIIYATVSNLAPVFLIRLLNVEIWGHFVTAGADMKVLTRSNYFSTNFVVAMGSVKINIKWSGKKVVLFGGRCFSFGPF